MKKIQLIIPAVLLLWLTGCAVTSVYPFYTKKDVTFDPALVGSWVNADTNDVSGDTWKFEAAEERAYKFTLIESDQTAEYEAHLFRLGKEVYLDFLTVERHEGAVPAHFLMKVKWADKQLHLSLMNYGWLTKQVEKNPRIIRHLLVPDKPGADSAERVVLTADTGELQKFIRRHAGEEEFFVEPVVLKRKE